MSRPAIERAAPTPEVAAWRRRVDRALAPALEGLVLWPIEHWLLLMNALAALTLLGALASPLVRVAVSSSAAAWIDALYSYICLQRPSHSFFLLGYQVPLEQRMLALAGAQLVGGLLYARAGGHLPPLEWRLLVVGFLPATVDVLTQTLGWRDSTWLVRTLTGWLFGLAFVLWAYPLLDRLLVGASPRGTRGA